MASSKRTKVGQTALVFRMRDKKWWQVLFTLDGKKPKEVWRERRRCLLGRRDGSGSIRFFLEDEAALKYAGDGRALYTSGDRRKRLFHKVVRDIIRQAKQFRELAAKQKKREG